MMLDPEAQACVNRLARHGYLFIVEDVCRRHQVTMAILLGRSRYAPVAAARRELYALLRLQSLSYPEIGDLLGRNHSTIIFGVQEYERAPSRFRIAS